MGKEEREGESEVSGRETERREGESEVSGRETERRERGEKWNEEGKRLLTFVLHS